MASSGKSKKRRARPTTGLLGPRRNTRSSTREELDLLTATAAAVVTTPASSDPTSYPLQELPQNGVATSESAASCTLNGTESHHQPHIHPARQAKITKKLDSITTTADALPSILDSAGLPLSSPGLKTSSEAGCLAVIPSVEPDSTPGGRSGHAAVLLAMASSRSRQQRGGPRSNGQDAGEEMALWSGAQSDILKITRSLARAEDCRNEIETMESMIAGRSSPASVEELDKLSTLYREQVKLSEEVMALGSTGDNSALQKLSLLKAMVEHNEKGQALIDPGPRVRAPVRDPSKTSAMDLDGPSDSPAPSPIADKPRKERLGSSRSSLPPKDVAIKQESADPSGGSEMSAKGKITFAMGAEVAFRPKATGSEEPDWIQGTVVKIIGEGKSRRYDVQDPEPDEVTKKPGQIYRTSASSMVTIPPLGQHLADYSKGKHVLARYPDTTTFYRAEVVGMNGTMVNLKFEGEEDAQVTTEVDRRFVLDHRG